MFRLHAGRLSLAVSLIALSVPARPAGAQQQPVLLPIALRLAATDIKPELGFSGVVGAAFLPNGSIVVGDAGRRSIHRFDSKGRYLGSVGRAGQGPGEFTDLDWLIACADGSVLAFDSANSRITIYDRNMTYVRTFVAPAFYLFDQVLSCEDPTQAVLLLDQPRSRPARRGLTVTLPAALGQTNWTTNRVDTISMLTGTEYFFGAARGYVDLPLGGKAMASASRGFIVAGSSSEQHVLYFRNSLTRADTVRIPRASTGSVASAWKQAVSARIDQEYSVRSREMVKLLLDEARAPSRLPSFTALLADPFAATAWARLPDRNSASRWVRLHPSASKRTEFTLPANVQVMAITAAHLLGLQRNEDGTEEVLVYRFAR